MTANRKSRAGDKKWRSQPTQADRVQAKLRDRAETSPKRVTSRTMVNGMTFDPTEAHGTLCDIVGALLQNLVSQGFTSRIHAVRRVA